jgi:transcriptional regulator with AAA-type ATPase domain
MIQDKQLLDEFHALPPEKQAKVIDFIESLKLKQSQVSELKSEEQDRPRLTFGCMKGIVKYIAEDFDEPLEDFAEYM